MKQKHATQTQRRNQRPDLLEEEEAKRRLEERRLEDEREQALIEECLAGHEAAEAALADELSSIEDEIDALLSSDSEEFVIRFIQTEGE